jgi:hypothetical protein
VVLALRARGAFAAVDAPGEFGGARPARAEAPADPAGP